jgi:cell division protein FtsL
VTNRSQLLSQASKYLSMLPANPSCSKILLETLDENLLGKPSISTVMWAIENLVNSSIVEVPIVAKAAESSEIKQLKPPSPTQIVVPRPEGKKRPTKKILIYSAVSIVYLVTAIFLIVAKSNNSSLNSEVKELNGQIDSLLNDIDDKDNTISDLEDSNASLGEDLSSVQYDLATANSTIDVLQQPQSTYFDYDGSWQLFSNGDESCRGWTDSARVCTRLKNVTRFTISSGSVTFSDNIISSIYAGYSTSGGFFGSVTEEAWGTCGDLDTYANVTFNLIADTVSPRVSGIQATDAHGEITLKVPSQRGCDGASLSFSFTATR